MDMLGAAAAAGASLVHAGLGVGGPAGAAAAAAASANHHHHHHHVPHHHHHGLTDLGGLEGLVNNSAAVDHIGSHHHHQYHQAAAHHPHLAPHHAVPQHHHHHHHAALAHHAPNQPLPPHRPFTPPGALSSHQLHSTVAVPGLDNNNATASSADSYSPNSTTHIPSSTVKIKSGEKTHS